MKILKILFMALTFKSVSSAASLPSITCYNTRNATYFVSLKAHQPIASSIAATDSYIAEVKNKIRAQIDEFDSLARMDVSPFSNGRRSGTTYKVTLQNGTQIFVTSSCLHAPDVCDSWTFSGKINEASTTVNQLTCKFE